jgi:HD-GYP domain-containing protein (c-di-GMP phosphodiesterase class II)
MTNEASSKKVLLVTRQDLLIDVVSVYLEGWFQSKVEVADTSLKLEKSLGDGAAHEYGLVILEDDKLMIAAGKTLADLLSPAIVIGREPATKPVSGRRVLYLKSPIDLQRLSDSINLLSQDSSPASRSFCAVRPQVLVMSGKVLAQDIFVQKSDGGFDLSLKKGESIELGEALLKRAGTSRLLFMRGEDFASFLRRFAEELQELSGGADEVFDLGNAVNLTSSVHEMLAETLPELGFNQELQKATRASIDMVMTSIRRDPRMGELLEALANNESEYLSWHSTTLCYLACRLSSLMTWDSANTHYKLSLASFLHDITLKHKELHRVKTLEELGAANASEPAREEFREHAHAAAALARSMKDFPGDVDHIIAQHHELPSGKGFPLGLNHTKISPLAAVFIVAHDLTDELFEKRQGLKLSESVARLEKTYTQGYFKRVIQALKDLSGEPPAL